MLKNWWFWTVVLEKTLESPLDCKEIQPVHPKGNQSWVFIGRTDAEAETPVLWPPHVKSWLTGKNPDAGRDWEQEEKGMTEDEMAGWHNKFDGHGFGWNLEVGDGQGGLACWDSRGRKESGTTEWLNWRQHYKWTIHQLKKVGKITRPFRHDLNQIPYDYTVEVTNRFKGLDLIDRVPDELRTEVCDIIQETGIKIILMEKKCKKAKWLSEEALQIAVKRR